MGRQKDGGLVSRAVREALGTLVSPHVYGQLVARALQSAGLTAIPESGPEVATWVTEGLRREIEQSVGSDAAELVLAQLAPIVGHAMSAAKASEPASVTFGSEKPTSVAVAQLTARAEREQQKSTARVRLSPAQMRQLSGTDAGHTTRPLPNDEKRESASRAARVLTVTAERRAVEALSASLGASVNVLQVIDLVGLLDALDEPGLRSPIIVLDCMRPAVHVTSIAAMSEDLPAGTTVVLWGASDESWRELNRDSRATCRWVRCSHEATVADLASLCAMLIG